METKPHTHTHNLCDCIEEATNILSRKEHNWALNTEIKEPSLGRIAY